MNCSNSFLFTNFFVLTNKTNGQFGVLRSFSILFWPMLLYSAASLMVNAAFRSSETFKSDSVFKRPSRPFITTILSSAESVLASQLSLYPRSPGSSFRSRFDICRIAYRSFLPVFLYYHTRLIEWSQYFRTCKVCGKVFLAKSLKYDTENMTVAEVKELIWRYFMSYWNNRRICSSNEGLPPLIKRRMYYDSEMGMVA